MSIHRNHDVGPKGWFILGTIFGFAVTAMFSVGLLALNPEDGFIRWLKDWQTLLGGLLALAGALATVAWIQKQIDNSQAQEDERRERRHYAARATMPAALADLQDYADGGMSVLRKIPHPVHGGSTVRLAHGEPAPTLPRIPSEAVETLRTCIETADAGPQQAIAGLLSLLQVYNSRLHGLFENLRTPAFIVTTDNVYHVMADGLELSLRCDRMFDYARGEAHEINSTIMLDDMTSKARRALLNEYPGLSETLARRYRPMISPK